ncbi:unnamed protein product [Heligmosomoides polygyrus]|uniref:RUN domain-containing protein n=1 Tax=Heligmosomoides polygyrus TaxID=6339 RepID=A0A183G7F6_HELPZ|nr:unnamed protein product [Heligmosomoides polygyrus]
MLGRIYSTRGRRGVCVRTHFWCSVVLKGSRLFEMRRVAVEPVGDAVLCHQVIHCSPLKLLLDSIENQFKAALSCDDKVTFFFQVVDYKWVVREEFWSTVPSKKYKSCVNSVFLE